MNETAFKVRIHGIVQGVGFRYFTLHKAREYGVNGYVRNMPDGSVEAYAIGARDILEQFLADLERGPSGSAVDRMDVDWNVAIKEYDTFNVTY